MSDTFDIEDAKTQLSTLIERAQAGDEILITRDGKAVVRLVPLPKSLAKRRPAGALGLTFISPEFDAPLPRVVEDGFNGR